MVGMLLQQAVVPWFVDGVGFLCFACFLVAVLSMYRGLQQGSVAVCTRSHRRCSHAGGVLQHSWLRLLVLCCAMRIGEALHPGPVSDSWTCGLFNPSGLSTKVDFLSQIPLDVMLGSETHLTRSGLSRLRSGLRAQKSAFTSVVTGAPCTQQVEADAGTYAGVIVLSKYPARSLPHSIGVDVYNTARVMVCGISIRQMWVQVGVAYGYPHSVQHKHRTYKTECLLEELILRIGHQSKGPRIIAGDWNHPAASLQQTARLRQLGFREVQEVAKTLWNFEIQPTSTGDLVIGHMWISAELQALLSDVKVHWDDWASHATVVATFNHAGPELARSLWVMPTPFPWPAEWNLHVTVDWTDPSLAYASWWHQLESQAAAAATTVVPKASRGRGQTLEATRQMPFLAPCKQGRPGDLQPEFYGASLRHCRWFRQLRRLHSLSRLLNSGSSKPMHSVKIVELWRAVRTASGFPSGFGTWWVNTFDGPFRWCLPVTVPSASQVDDMFGKFKECVRQLETKLGATRLKAAKQKRVDDANLVFKDCMRDAPQPVDTLVKSKELCVEAVCPDDQSVVFTCPVTLNESLPIVVQGRAVSILAACHDQVWLESIEGISVGDLLRQESVVATDDGILAEFSAVWKSRWVKMSHVQPGQWTQITAFCRRVFAPIPWTFPAWNLDGILSALHAKKHRAAVGPDGVSRADLLALPRSALQPLVDLYCHVELGHAWPQQLLQGFVNCLDKQKGDGGVDSYRPIVIYPLLMRLWSTIRAKQALACVGPFLPEGLHGGVPKKQAKSIWYRLAQKLETAHFLGESLLGVAVDIQRAFNNLPREPIFCAAVQLGLPSHVLHPWASFLTAQCRMFKIRGVVGPRVPSTSGFPEGCAWSVFAMGLADWMLTRWLASHISSPHEALTFVDDWHIIYLDPSAFEMVWEALLSFVSSLQLTLDLGKSFCWAAQAADRKLLARRPISSVLAARDLGAHQNFSLRSGNRTVLERLEAVSDLWPKLRKSLSPYEVKLRILTQMAWPRAMHGISVVHLGATRFVNLRSGAMNGLRVNRVGANPVLRLMQHGVLSDPEAWAIVQTVREAREVGVVDQLETMLDFASRDCVVPPNGPCAVLIARLRRLGWTLCPGGYFSDCLGPLNVLRMSFAAFVARVQWSWPRVAATAVAHRSSFAGIQMADVSEARKVLKDLGDTDRKFLQCCMDGTLYQDLKKTKAQRGAGSRCLFCGQLDSIYHRVWECEHFASCRTSCRFRSLVPDLAPCLTCHGWPITPAAWFDFARLLLCAPDVGVAVTWPAVPSSHVHHLFVDGACHHPDEPKLRYAAWGVTLASAGVGSLNRKILACGHVKGLEQTSYRGELQAMVYALRAIAQGNVKAVVWCDCASVVRRTRKILAGGVVSPNAPHADLWMIIYDLVAADLLQNVTIQKVVSHCPVHSALDDTEAWAFWRNQLVDRATGSSCFISLQQASSR